MIAIICLFVMSGIGFSGGNGGNFVCGTGNIQGNNHINGGINYGATSIPVTQNANNKQAQGQLQGQLQGQKQTSINKNNNLNLNANKNVNKNANLNLNANKNVNKTKQANVQKTDVKLIDNTIVEDKIQPINITVTAPAQGYNEKKENGSQYVPLEQITTFSATVTREEAEEMLSSKSTGKKLGIRWKVKKGKYEPTDKITVLFEKPQGNSMVDFGCGPSVCTNKYSNSVGLFAKNALAGMDRGATHMLLIQQGSDRQFQQRGVNVGGGGAGTGTQGNGTGSGLFGFIFGNSGYKGMASQAFNFIKLF